MKKKRSVNMALAEFHQKVADFWADEAGIPRYVAFKPSTTYRMPKIHAKGKPKKLQPGRLFKTKVSRGVRRNGKTARILAILSDGLPHVATKIGKKLGMGSGAVAQHLAGRVKKGLVRRVLPGVFQMAWPKGKKAA